MIEEITNLTVGEFVCYIALFITGVSAVVEKASKTKKPLTKFARAIGRALNGDLIEKVDKLEKDIQQLDHAAGERRAKDARARVLRFGDELIHDVRHSKEHFDDILQDITEYEKYCDEHPEFENDRMQLTAETIKTAYKKCWQEHSFL